MTCKYFIFIQILQKLGTICGGIEFILELILFIEFIVENM